MSIRFSACIEMLFADAGDFYDRFRAAREAGLDAVEFWGWANKDLARVKELKEEYGLTVAAFCVDTKREEVAKAFNAKRLVDRSGAVAFVEALKDTVEEARRLSVPSAIITVGQELSTLSRHEQHANIVHALRLAAPVLKGSGVRLVVEPLNVTHDHFSYYLYSSYEAFAILDEVASPDVTLLYDIYHQQCGEGNLIYNIKRNIAAIGHFHVADVPGRHEPGTGEINYRNVFSAIGESGYGGFVGLEYKPTRPTAETIRTLYALA